MFANLVAADMNLDQKAKVHPAFVELIKEMTPSEAKILADMEDGRHIIFKVRLGTGSRFQELARHYTFANDGIGGAECLRGVSNLQRLGLVEERVEWPSLEDLVAREAAVRRRYDHVTAAIAGEELPGDGKRQI